MSFSVAEPRTLNTTTANSPCPNKILRIASLHTILTFEGNDVHDRQSHADVDVRSAKIVARAASSLVASSSN
jgi:hypothetical protein